jgi:hypothetical protein
MPTTVPTISAGKKVFLPSPEGVADVEAAFEDRVVLGNVGGGIIEV